MGRADPQLKLRLTEEMKEIISAAAKANGRSVNSEIVARLEASEAGDGAQVAELKRQLHSEHEAYLRLESVFDSQMNLIEDFRRVIRRATEEGIGQAKTIEALCNILISLDAAPSAEVVDMAKRLLEVAIAQRNDLTETVERQKQRAT
ncbi:Arc family DNA-binding protein [Rhizobium sp. Pop5]|uniref:Arc family DNA-binding protein n=1 Tax=Rhizobium sp. Pop5 TaxID=1223565 RepID=UPI000283C334|nr:Arc family DNA-binding protein [Rhizobium sp. Pop5]EJZ22431.1 bacteriophage regulatory protein [Rhizobium sp. Pop5]UVD57263.1 Arc family DNA-binding protein [Rhizobium sp. Pop5]